MKKMLTPRKIAAIRERRNAGASVQELAEAFKCSTGSISNALHAPTPSAPKAAGRKAAESKPETPTPEEDSAPPTPEDLRRSLAQQVRQLQADAKNAPTPALRAATNRLLVATQQLLSKMTPPDHTVAPTGMMLVDTNEMEELAKTAELRFEQLIHGAFKEREAWPTCRACGQRIAPKE